MDDDEGRARLAESGAALVAGVRAVLPGWLHDRSVRVLDAWGRVEVTVATRARDELASAGESAAGRIATAIDDLAHQPVARHRTTPLELLRSAYREPTEVLSALAIPAVVRDAFDERFAPDDVYDLSPKGFADLGDAELGAHLIRWGVVKARLLRGEPPPAG